MSQFPAGMSDEQRKAVEDHKRREREQAEAALVAQRQADIARLARVDARALAARTAVASRKPQYRAKLESGTLHSQTVVDNDLEPR